MNMTASGAGSGLTNDPTPVGPGRLGDSESLGLTSRSGYYGTGAPSGSRRGSDQPGPDKMRWFKAWFRPQFDHWVMGPIERLAPTQDALVSFILMSCAIDYLASFWFGDDTTGHVRQAYEGFVRKYMPKYIAEDLYFSLRNGVFDRVFDRQDQANTQYIVLNCSGYAANMPYSLNP
jgi:hypothetical protein